MTEADCRQKALEEAVRELLVRAGYLLGIKEDLLIYKDLGNNKCYSTIEALERANLYRLANAYKKIEEHEKSF